MEKIGEVVKKHRKEKGLKLREVAEYTGFSTSYISDVEAGRYNPSVKLLVALAKVLDIDLNFLI